MRAWAIAWAMTALACPGVGAQQVEVTGTFAVLWGDPVAGGGASGPATIAPAADAEPIVVYRLAADDGRTLELRASDALLEPYGGALGLHGRRVTVSLGSSLAPGAPGAGAAPRADVRALRLAPAPLPVGPTLRAPAGPSGATPAGRTCAARPRRRGSPRGSVDP